MDDPFDTVKGINMSVGVFRKTEKQSWSRTVKTFGCVRLGDEYSKRDLLCIFGLSADRLISSKTAFSTSVEGLLHSIIQRPPMKSQCLTGQ